MSKKCSVCGAILNDNAKFCSKCGKRLDVFTDDNRGETYETLSAESSGNMQQSSKKKKRKVLKIVLVVIVIYVAFSIVFGVMSSRDDEEDSLTYTNDRVTYDFDYYASQVDPYGTTTVTNSQGDEFTWEEITNDSVVYIDNQDLLVNLVETSINPTYDCTWGEAINTYFDEYKWYEESIWGELATRDGCYTMSLCGERDEHEYWMSILFYTGDKASWPDNSYVEFVSIESPSGFVWESSTKSIGEERLFTNVDMFSD